MKTQMKAYNVPTGQYNFHLDDLFQGDVPSSLVICMVKSKAFIGDYALNPFDMQHFDLTTLGVFVNDESLPGKPLQMSFSSSDGYATAYHSLFAGHNNRDGDNWGLNIEYRVCRIEYSMGYTLT